MADKLMYIHKDDAQNNPSVEYNQWLKRLDTQPNDPNNQKSNPQSLRKRYYKTLGTSALNSQMSPPSLLTKSQWNFEGRIISVPVSP